MSKILTIAIPTYNRSFYLNELLKSLENNNISCYKDEIDILVVDNASTDETIMVVEKFIKKGLQIKYIKNEYNIGPDRNFLKCYEECKTKYFHLCGDDDIFLKGSIEKIMSTVKSEHNYGIIYLNYYGFKSDYEKEQPKQKVVNEQFTVCTKEELIRKVHYYFTFITANIINKDLALLNRIDYNKFLDTNLVQLSYTFSALFNSSVNVYVNDFVFAAKADNTGGYKLFEVFGKNMNLIFDYFINLGINKEYFNFINKKLILEFFPSFVIKFKESERNSFHEENNLEILKLLYTKYIEFWLYLFPIIILPLKLAKYMHFISRNIYRIVTKVFGGIRIKV